jgi:DNA-directed RNA polymerase subunit M/transcription elongation factor TFIIS
MLKGFYDTDNEFIISESKKIFGIDVCPTCHGQIVNAYNRLKTYYLNEEQMAKKKQEENISDNETLQSKNNYTVKKAFLNSVVIRQNKKIILGHVPSDKVETLFTEKEIALYFE